MATTTIAFWIRAQVFLDAHGIHQTTRVATDNGSNYRTKNFDRAVLATGAQHQRIPPTPKHQGQVEQHNRTLAEGFLNAREWTSETQRTAALDLWNIHYNYHRRQTSAGDQPPASRLRAIVTNVMTALAGSIAISPRPLNHSVVDLANT